MEHHRTAADEDVLNAGVIEGVYHDLDMRIGSHVLKRSDDSWLDAATAAALHLCDSRVRATPTFFRGERHVSQGQRHVNPGPSRGIHCARRIIEQLPETRVSLGTSHEPQFVQNGNASHRGGGR
jgi:hypothetical protein